MRDLAALASAITAETSFQRAAFRLQMGARWLTGAAEGVVAVFDWKRRTAWTLQGTITNPSVKDLVAQVAGSGQRSVLGNALLEPIGPSPARVVLALRKPHGGHFTNSEIAMMNALSMHIAPSLERLLGR